VSEASIDSCVDGLVDSLEQRFDDWFLVVAAEFAAGGDRGRQIGSGSARVRTEETRAELVAATTKAFRDYGFHGASLAQTARGAGYSTGAVYWHFGGKDELFMAVFEAYALTRVAELTEIQRAPVRRPG